MEDVDELKASNRLSVVLSPVDSGVGVDVAFWENGGEGETVVAINEVVVYVVDLC